jgi:amino acid transporter
MTPETIEPVNVLRKNAVGVTHIVFFVVAAAAPLTAVVGVTPAAFAYGNGPGVPGTFLLVGVLYFFFIVGFTAMNCFVKSAGGFYPYISAGLGRPLGVAGVLIALATYNAVDIAVYGLFGFFGSETVKAATGVEITWWVYAIVLCVGVCYCGSRNIEFSGKILGLCMLAEVAILLLLDAVIVLKGTVGISTGLFPFAAEAVFGRGFGVSLVFVVSSFIGIEATVIFGEEARDPEKSISKAAYISVGLIAGFYALSTWAITIHYGSTVIAAEAARNPATLYLGAIQSLLGPTAAIAMNALLITSLCAGALSFHNTINRYLFAIGREGLIWKGCGRTHASHKSPFVAGMAQTFFALTVIGAFALCRQDPYAVVFAWMGTFASLGILVVQVLVSVAVIVFFSDDARGQRVWPRLIAPLLAAVGLCTCFILMAANLALVSGSDSAIVESFPGVLLLVGIAGCGFALILKVRKPAIYHQLGRAFD